MLISRILKANPGTIRAFHVFTPALQHRLEHKESRIPVMAIRSSRHNYQKMRLYSKIVCLGQSEMREMFDKPLPGTGGRGVAICFTDGPVRVWYDDEHAPVLFNTADGTNPKDVLAKVVSHYDSTANPTGKSQFTMLTKV